MLIMLNTAQFWLIMTPTGGNQVRFPRYIPSQNYVKITGHNRSCTSHTYHDRQYNQRYTEVTTDE